MISFSDEKAVFHSKCKGLTVSRLTELRDYATDYRRFNARTAPTLEMRRGIRWLDQMIRSVKEENKALT